MKKKLIILTIFVIILGAVAVFYIFNKPRNSIAEFNADYVLSAETLIKQFESDAETYTKKYTNKIIEINGVISEINVNKTGAKTCILREDGYISGVICEFEPGKSNELKDYSPGKKIYIKGKFSGYLMDVVLNTCEIKQN